MGGRGVQVPLFGMTKRREGQLYVYEVAIQEFENKQRRL